MKQHKTWQQVIETLRHTMETLIEQERLSQGRPKAYFTLYIPGQKEPIDRLPLDPLADPATILKYLAGWYVPKQWQNYTLINQGPGSRLYLIDNDTNRIALELRSEDSK